MSFLHHPLRSEQAVAPPCSTRHPSLLPRLRQQQVCGPHLTSTAGAGPSACSHTRTHTRASVVGGDVQKQAQAATTSARGSEQDAPTRRRDPAPAHLSVRAASHRLRSPSQPCPLRVARGLVSAWSCRPFASFEGRLRFLSRTQITVAMRTRA